MPPQISTLFLEGNETQTDQTSADSAPNFICTSERLPGGRFEEGEFLLDPLFEEAPITPRIGRCKSSLIREPKTSFSTSSGNTEISKYINLGRLPESLSKERP